MGPLRAIASSIACTVALCVAGVLGPSGGGAALLVLPLPVLVLGGLAGLAASLTAVAVSALVLGLTIGPDVGAFYVAIAGVPVLLGVWALGAGWRIESSVVLSAGALLVGVLVSMLWMSGDMGTLRTAAAQAWNESFDQTLAWYRLLGVSDEALTDLQLQRNDLMSSVRSVAPAVAVVVAGAVWFINIRIARRWLPWPQLYNLHEWQAPVWLIWVLIAPGFDYLYRLMAFLGVACVLSSWRDTSSAAIVSYYLQRLQLRRLRIASYL
jgi:hypothetical protein